MVSLAALGTRRMAVCGLSVCIALICLTVVISCMPSSGRYSTDIATGPCEEYSWVLHPLRGHVALVSSAAWYIALWEDVVLLLAHRPLFHLAISTSLAAVTRGSDGARSTIDIGTVMKGSTRLVRE